MRGIRPSTFAGKRIPSVPVKDNFNAAACNRPSRSSRITTEPGTWVPTVKPFDPKLAQMIIDRDNEYERSLTEIIEYIKVKIQ